MSGTNFFRLIEAYFDGSILPNEKIMLEKQIQKDPLLKAEFSLQQSIITGIKQNRTLQLKQRLSAIDVPTITPTATYLGAVKWLAATISTATLFGALLYWYTGDNNPIIPLDLKTSDVIYFENREPKKALAPPIPINFDENVASKLTTSITIAQSTLEISIARNEPVVDEDKPTSTQKNAEVMPQSLLSFEDEKLFESNNSNVLKSLSPIAVNLQRAQNSEIELNKAQIANKYHYQYTDNKLYLYGDFDDEPYEIIELKNQGNKKLYLSYKKAIYLIDTAVQEISELQQITDPKLKDDLFLIIESK